MSSSSTSDGESFDQTTRKGKENGLFQASMKAIRSAHFRANRLRAGLILSGLFTDKLIYREVITVFYVVTKDMEQKIRDKKFASTKRDQELLAKVRSLQYSFTEGYEKDLAYLYSKKTWQKEVQAVLERNHAAKDYHTKIQDMTTATEVIGAACVLWGALVIGGGAAAMPRVKSLCGEQATNLFQSVIGPGREERRQTFIEVWDSLAEPDTPEFDEIVRHTQECMQMNNNVLASLQQNPWWLTYLLALVVGIALAFLYFVEGERLLPSEAESQEL